MSVKTTIITFVLAVIAVTAALVTAGGDRAARAARGATPLVTAEQLPVDSIMRMTLTKRGEETLTFERQPAGGWMQVQPFAHAMDAFRMRQLAAIAREVRITDHLEPGDLRDGLTLATLGLDPPDALITYEWGRESLTLALGRRGIAGRAYARLNDDDRVFIVSQELHDFAVEMSPKEWRDRSLFRNVGIDCDRIVREDGAVRLVLERDRRTWRMIEPVRTRVDQEALDRLMQAMGGARAGGFIADQPAPGSLARFGLAPSAATIEITCTTTTDVEDDMARNTREQRLLVGIPAGAGTQDRFGMIEGRPSVVRVPVAALQHLFMPVDGLIDPTGSGVFAADVKSIRIISQGSEFRIERDLDRWRAPDANRREVPAALANDLLAKLTDFRAPEVAVQEYPQELEVAVITLFGFNDRPMDTVRVLHHAESEMWALENGDGVLRIFPPGFEIALTPAEFGLSQ